MRALAPICVAIATGLCVLACGDVRSAVATPAAPRLINAVLDSQIVQLEVGPGDGPPTVAESQAIQLAKSNLSASTPPIAIQTELVRLTVRTADGPVVRGIQDRPAWLITFKGVGYAPPGSTGSVCSCSAGYDRPNTLAALDAETGAVLALMGVSG